MVRKSNNNKKDFPKAKNIFLALLNIPKWKSAVPIDPAMCDRYDIDISKVGVLTQEIMEAEKGKTEGALLQREMILEFAEWVKLRLGLHEEVEEIRAELQELMYETAAREDMVAMDAILAGTKYQKHYEVWQHQLAGEKKLISDKAEYEKETINVDLDTRLRMAYNSEAKKQEAFEVKVTKLETVKEENPDLLATRQHELAQIKAKREEFDKLIKR
jgi:hypothetical protein